MVEICESVCQIKWIHRSILQSCRLDVIVMLMAADE